jgi:uncharacterized membrane protein YeiH
MDMIYILDLIGTCVFAISGSLSGAKKRLDVLGVGVIGFVTAIGGGTIRDLILDVPVCWVKDMNYLFVITLGILLAIFFKSKLDRFKRAFFLFDTIGIAVFTIIGTEKALHLEYSAVVAIILGVNSAVSGGVIRDTLCNDIPLIFHKEVYASACLAGGIIFLILNYFNINVDVSTLTTIFVVIIIRVLSIKYHWNLPRVEL